MHRKTIGFIIDNTELLERRHSVIQEFAKHYNVFLIVQDTFRNQGSFTSRLINFIHRRGF